MTSDLITRLSKLDAPDREVDAEICILFQYGGLNSEGATNVRTDPDWDGDLLFEIGNEACCNPVPKLTASVDAAVALAERVLPFTHLVSAYHDDMACSVKIHCCPEGLSGEWKFDVKGDHEHLAVAYCIAILRAIALLRAKEASK